MIDSLVCGLLPRRICCILLAVTGYRAHQWLRYFVACKQWNIDPLSWMLIICNCLWSDLESCSVIKQVVKACQWKPIDLVLTLDSTDLCVIVPIIFFCSGSSFLVACDCGMRMCLSSSAHTAGWSVLRYVSASAGRADGLLNHVELRGIFVSTNLKGVELVGLWIYALMYRSENVQ